MKILGDFTTTVKKALYEIDPNWEKYHGLIVCGTHTPHDWDEMITEIKRARIERKPFLGICFGHQLAAIEYAINVLGMKNATSEELDTRGNHFSFDYVVTKLPQLKVGQFDGETYWNNYEVREDILKLWKKEENFITCQFHPEYQSSIDKPHPLLLKFMHHAKNAKPVEM